MYRSTRNTFYKPSPMRRFITVALADVAECLIGMGRYGTRVCISGTMLKTRITYLLLHTQASSSSVAPSRDSTTMRCFTPSLSAVALLKNVR